MYSSVIARLAAAVLLLLALIAAAQPAEDWQSTLNAAEGQTVYFNAWGGSEPINEYLTWAADELAARYAVNLVHVKVGDIGDVVSRLLAEKAAGRDTGGSVDLMWINGENFRAMKEQDLLLPPWTHRLPNYSLADTAQKPTLLMDFSTPVDHMEAPWGMAQLVFMYDSARISTPPRSMAALLAHAQANPGRITYPAPPNFYGTTFLKQVMLEISDDPEVFYQPATNVDTEAALAPLWTYLDALHAVAWQDGRTFPQDAPQMRQMLNDGEVQVALSFNPNDAANAIAQGDLPNTVRTYVHAGGTLGNTHFVGIPYNAQAPEAAQVVANFLLSPEAQARKADPAIWGDPTVLAMDKLTPAKKALFDAIETGPATLTAEELAAVLPEPHATWVPVLEAGWQERYAR